VQTNDMECLIAYVSLLREFMLLHCWKMNFVTGTAYM